MLFPLVWKDALLSALDILHELCMMPDISLCISLRFDTAKGFGFIVPDDGSNDVFVHQTAIKIEGFRSLAEGENVEFRVEVDKNGRTKAVDVTGPDGSDVKGAPYNPNKGFEEW